MTRRRLIYLLAAVAVTWLAYRFMVTDAVREAARAAMAAPDLGLLLLAFVFVPIVQWLRAWRFSLLLTRRTAYPDRRLFDITALLVAINFVAPFRLGELSFPMLLRRSHRLPFMTGTGVLVYARIMDLAAVMALFAAAGMWLAIAGALGTRWAWLSIVIPALLALPVLVPASAAHLRRFAHAAPARWPRLQRSVAHLVDGLASVEGLSMHACAAGLSYAIWLSHAAMAWCAANAVGATLDPSRTVLAGTAANLAFALPVSGVAGLGAPQAAWAGVLHATDIGWDIAVISALAYHFVALAGALLLGLFAFARSGGWLFMDPRPDQWGR